VSDTRLTYINGDDESDYYRVEPLAASDNKPAYLLGLIYVDESNNGPMWYHVYREKSGKSYPIGSERTLREALSLLRWSSDLNLQGLGV
jgi:hypothetical protein